MTLIPVSQEHVQHTAKIRDPVICFSALVTLWNRLVSETRQVRRACWTVNIGRLYKLKASGPLRRLKTVVTRWYQYYIDHCAMLKLN